MFLKFLISTAWIMGPPSTSITTFRWHSTTICGMATRDSRRVAGVGCHEVRYSEPGPPASTTGIGTGQRRIVVGGVAEFPPRRGPGTDFDPRGFVRAARSRVEDDPWRPNPGRPPAG